MPWPSRLARSSSSAAPMTAVRARLPASAFASEAQLYYDTEIMIIGDVNATTKTYSDSVTAPTDVTKIKFDATLYQKQLIGRKKIATMSASANSNYCYKSQSAEIQTGKTYIVEIEGQVYFDGAWHDTNGDFTAKT